MNVCVSVLSFYLIQALFILWFHIIHIELYTHTHVFIQVYVTTEVTPYIIIFVVAILNNDGIYCMLFIVGQ